MAQGTVQWFSADKGFGFITPDDGRPGILVHYTAIHATGFQTLEEGLRVEYGMMQSNKGPMASDVWLL